MVIYVVVPTDDAAVEPVIDFVSVVTEVLQTELVNQLPDLDPESVTATGRFIYNLVAGAMTFVYNITQWCQSCLSWSLKGIT